MKKEAVKVVVFAIGQVSQADAASLCFSLPQAERFEFTPTCSRIDREPSLLLIWPMSEVAEQHFYLEYVAHEIFHDTVVAAEQGVDRKFKVASSTINEG